MCSSYENKEHPDYMLCLPWFFFFPEMREREEAYIQAGGKFILPLPNPVIVRQVSEKGASA